MLSDIGTLHLFELDIDIWAETITLKYIGSNNYAPRPKGHIPFHYFVWEPGISILGSPQHYAEMLSVELTERVFGRE
jgi:hypothetical protein